MKKIILLFCLMSSCYSQIEQVSNTNYQYETSDTYQDLGDAVSELEFSFDDIFDTPQEINEPTHFNKITSRIRIITIRYLLFLFMKGIDIWEKLNPYSATNIEKNEELMA